MSNVDVLHLPKLRGHRKNDRWIDCVPERILEESNYGDLAPQSQARSRFCESRRADVIDYDVGTNSFSEPHNLIFPVGVRFVVDRQNRPFRAEGPDRCQFRIGR